MISKTRSAGLGATAVVTLALVAAGCGGSGSSSSSTPSSTLAGATGATGATGAQGGAGGQSVTDYQAYIGGKPGKADSSKSPIYIGWVTQHRVEPAQTKYFFDELNDQLRRFAAAHDIGLIDWIGRQEHRQG